MLYLAVHSSRTVYLKHHSGSDFSRQEPPIDSISLSDPAIDVTSTHLAYRPSYSDYHGSGLAGMFINMEAVFPCFTAGTIDCRMFTHEEDGFNGGNVIIESGDSGNEFQIFSTSTDIATYGFAIQGCTQMDSTCLRTKFEVGIICLLPRAQCS